MVQHAAGKYAETNRAEDITLNEQTSEQWPLRSEARKIHHEFDVISVTYKFPMALNFH